MTEICTHGHIEMKREKWATIAIEGRKVITGISRSNFTVNLRHSRKSLRVFLALVGSMVLLAVLKVFREYVYSMKL